MKWYVFRTLILVLFFAMGCKADRLSGDLTSGSGDDDGGGDDSTPVVTCPTTQSITVSHLYDTTGSGSTRWMDYVDDDGVNAYSATNTPCNSLSGDYYESCIHAGEKLTATLTGISSCAGLTIADNNNAFDWTCKPGAGSVTIYSDRLQDDKGLVDLIDPGGIAFKSFQLSVTDSDSCLRGQSTASPTWWANTVEALPDINTGNPAQDLSDSSKIYTLGTSGTTNGFNIDADKIAIVTLGSAVLSYDGSTDDNVITGSGELDPVPANNDIIGLIAIGSQSFSWIEGTFNGSNATQAVNRVFHIHIGHFTRFNNVKILNTDSVPEFGVRFQNSDSSLHSNVTVVNTFESGYSLGTANNNRLYNLQLRNIKQSTSCCNKAFRVGGRGNRHQKIHVSNNANSNAFDDFGSGNVGENTFVEIVMGSSGQRGFATLSSSAGGGGQSTVHAMTGVNLNGRTIEFGNFNDQNTVTQVVGVNSGNLYLDADGNRFAQISMMNSAGAYEVPGDNNEIFSQLLIGNNAALCNVTGTGNFVDNSCNYGSATPAIAPDLTTLDGTTIFNGKAATDATNAHGTTTLLFDSITDWVNFDSPYRFWGESDANPFPHPGHRGNCSTGETCQIYDIRFSGLGGTTIEGINGTFAAGVACPASVDASTSSNVVTDQQSTPNTYLINAIEIWGDIGDDGRIVGDDDGLCESNEACIFMPNIGAYQGEGTLSIGTCTFTGGNGVTGVNIYGF